jgi:hypothetical protein
MVVFRPMKRLPLLFLPFLAGCVSQMAEPTVEAMDGAELLPEPPQAAAPASDAPVATEAAPVIKQQPRRRVVVAATPTPAPPKPEDVLTLPMDEVVVTPSSLTGYWRLTASHLIDVDVGLFSGVHIRYGGEMADRNICWLQQNGRKLSALCSSGAALKSAEGSVDDDGVTMRWWSGPATIIFSGKMKAADYIGGGFSGGVVGLSVTGNIPASLSRLEDGKMAPDPDRPSAAMLREVWEDVRKGRLTAGRYEGSGEKRVNQGLSKEVAAESPQKLLFLGQILIRWRKEQREFTEDVYQVATASGRDLCRIALNAGNQVSDFNCVTMPR